jgi:hypothetical protein
MRQSSDVKQCALQMALTHSVPLPQSAFVWHWGVRLVSATQTLATQTSWAGQSEFMVQSAWQKPLMQVWFAPQSVFATQAAPPVGLFTQCPPEQVWPVPQVVESLQPSWHSPPTHKPP